MIWFYKATTCLVGYDSYGTFETEDEDIMVADDIAWEYALENALSYFSVIEEDDVEDYEANGEEYMRTFIFENDVYATVTEYDPAMHDKYL